MAATAALHLDQRPQDLQQILRPDQEVRLNEQQQVPEKVQALLRPLAYQDVSKG